MQIAIVGRKSETANYVEYVKKAGLTPCVTLNSGKISDCDALLLPGGGDITPAFFGEKNHGSRNINTELDILQLQAFDLAVKKNMPILGICKGLQIINVGLGGTIIQDMPTARVHQYDKGDQYHPAINSKGSWLYELYGERCTVNSAHHQSIASLGNNLTPVQSCPQDGCIEAVVHSSLPIFGVQWHPERIDENRAKISGLKVLEYFVSVVASAPSFAACRTKGPR